MVQVDEGPGKNLGAIDWSRRSQTLRFKDVTIGSFDTSVIDKQGVQLTLGDMPNQIAHTRLLVRDPLGLVKCTGEFWASAKGSSFQDMYTLEVDSDGNGKVVTVSPPGGFNIGTAEVHHKMDQMGCEAVANVLHLVNCASIKLAGQQLQQKLVPIVADLVDTPLNVALKLLVKPPALGFGKEKLVLDNSFVSVDCGNQRFTHTNKGEFKSAPMLWNHHRCHRQHGPWLTIVFS